MRQRIDWRALVGNIFEIIFRLFLFAAGCGMSFACYTYLANMAPDMSLMQQILTIAIAVFIGIMGIGSIILSIWYTKIMEKEAEKDLEREMKEKKKERERSPEERLRRARRDETLGAVSCLLFAALFFYGFFAYADGDVLFMTVSLVGGLFLLYQGGKPLFKIIATRKGWKKAAERLSSEADVDERKLRERERKMATYVSDGTLVIATQNGDIRDAMEEYAEDVATNDVDGSAQLWKLERNRYAVTFPCGVSYVQLMQLMCVLSYQCNEIKVWMPSSVTKRTSGQWTLATVNDEGDLVAASDDGNQWIVPDQSDGNYRFQRSISHHITFQPRPNIGFNTVKKKALYY